VRPRARDLRCPDPNGIRAILECVIDAPGSNIAAVGPGGGASRKRRKRPKPSYDPIVLPFDNPYRFLVQSETDASCFYLVDLEEAYCDCDHHRIRKPRTCKHMDRAIALALSSSFDPPRGITSGLIE
jgi:hypothetical protein